MADGFIGMPSPEGSGKQTDTEVVLYDGQERHRERFTPLVAAYPVRDVLSSDNLAAGSSVDLDGTTIAASKTGKLIGADFSSSVACKWVFKSRDGAIELEFGTRFTGGLSKDPNDYFRPPDKNFCKLVGNGVDENFRVTVTNLDPENPANVYATIWWDEVDS